MARMVNDPQCQLPNVDSTIDLLTNRAINFSSWALVAMKRPKGEIRIALNSHHFQCRLYYTPGSGRNWQDELVFPDNFIFAINKSAREAPHTSWWRKRENQRWRRRIGEHLDGQEWKKWKGMDWVRKIAIMSVVYGRTDVRSSVDGSISPQWWNGTMRRLPCFPNPSHAPLTERWYASPFGCNAVDIWEMMTPNCEDQVSVRGMVHSEILYG